LRLPRDNRQFAKQPTRKKSECATYDAPPEDYDNKFLVPPEEVAVHPI